MNCICVRLCHLHTHMPVRIKADAELNELKRSWILENLKTLERILWVKKSKTENLLLFYFCQDLNPRLSPKTFIELDSLLTQRRSSVFQKHHRGTLKYDSALIVMPCIHNGKDQSNQSIRVLTL